MYNIKDQYQRTFKTLRISLTNACNLGCIYCVHKDDESLPLTPENKALSFDGLVHTIKGLKNILPIESIRLTGGEPTLYKNLVPLIKQIRELDVPKIKMTTNAYLLSGMVDKLADAGLDEVNISLDALDAESFYAVTRRKDVHRVLNAIDLCLQNKIEVKINTVVLKGVNDSQILPLLRYASERSITIRFLELMKMGYLHNKDFQSYFFSEQSVLDTIAEEFLFSKQSRTEGATANYWKTSEGYRFGIIANESSPFCQDCNRLRMDSYGNVFGCLSENIPVPVYECIDNEDILASRLNLALSHKQKSKFKGSELTMMNIGG